MNWDRSMNRIYDKPKCDKAIIIVSKPISTLCNRWIKLSQGKSNHQKKDSCYRVTPSIKIDQSNLICNSTTISLGPHNNKSLKLFKFFLNYPGTGHSLNELIENIYQISLSEKKTPRYTRALEHNMVKLISRTRHVANRAVNSSKSPWIRWFWHNKTLDKFYLYSLTNRYLVDRQNQILQHLSRGNSLF